MGDWAYVELGPGAIGLAFSLLALTAAPALADQNLAITPTVDGRPIESGTLSLEAGRTISLGVRITDRKNGFPLGDLHPAFWVRPATVDRDDCPAAVDRYLSLGPNAGIDDDLNGYLFATLNSDHSIGVMDPKLNLATSNLLSLTPRDASADAWWLDHRGARLFVASAEPGRLEMVDLLSGELTPMLSDLDDAGSIAAFPELDRLWVAGKSRMEGIALAGSTPVRTTATPEGDWQIEADHAGLRLLGLDHRAGHFLILHPESGRIERQIDLDGRRGMFVHDPRADAVYVIADGGSSIERLFLGQQHPTRHPLPLPIDRLLLTEDGDWLAGLNTRDGSLVLIDAASLRPVHVLQFDGRADQIRASNDYLYLLEKGTGYASLVHLPSLSREKSPGVLRIPIGPAAASGDTAANAKGPRLSGSTAPSAIAPLVEGGGAIIASASDKSLYLYMETGMQAPANAFRSWTAPPHAVALLDRRPTEHRAGHYKTAYRPKTPGAFELVIYLPNPKTVSCLPITVLGDGPDLAEALRPPRLIWAKPETPMIAGEPIELRFHLDGPRRGDRRVDQQPAQVLVMAPGRNWHWRGQALPIEKDRFSLSLVLPEPGSYQLLVRAPGHRLDFADQHPHSIHVLAER